MSASECIFCKIVAGTSPCQEVYRNDATVAFMDIHPTNDGHCLVIRKAHFENVFDMRPSDFGTVASTATKVARVVNEVLRPGGINLTQANGEAARQSVRHVHIHVLPRQAGDNLLMNWARDNSGDRRFDPRHIAEIAQHLRSRLSG